MRSSGCVAASPFAQAHARVCPGTLVPQRRCGLPDNRRTARHEATRFSSVDAWPPPPLASTGIVRLTIQDCWPRLGTGPLVKVNGWSYACRFGVQDICVWTGRTRVEVEMVTVLRFGGAVLDVDVPAGQVVNVWYAPPWMWPFPGQMGLCPQNRAGAWVFAVVAVLYVLGGLVVFLPD